MESGEGGSGVWRVGEAQVCGEWGRRRFRCAETGEGGSGVWIVGKEAQECGEWGRTRFRCGTLGTRHKAMKH